MSAGRDDQILFRVRPELVRDRPGVESGGQVAITEGLRAGEEVVTSAQFLIDSESKLREATAKMQSPKAPGQGALPHD